MNVFEQHDVKPGDYVEFTIHRVNSITDGGVVTSTNAVTTYRGKFGRVDGDYIVFQGGVQVLLNGDIRLDVVKHAEPPREVGWYEVSLIETSHKRARYWNGFGWAFSPRGGTFPMEFETIRFIGK